MKGKTVAILIKCLLCELRYNAGGFKKCPSCGKSKWLYKRGIDMKQTGVLKSKLNRLWGRPNHRGRRKVTRMIMTFKFYCKAKPIIPRRTQMWG
jgi:hypothetical protein